MKSIGKWLSVVLCLLVLAACLTGCGEKAGDASGGEKTVTVKVVHKDKTEKEFKYTSAEKYLGDVLEAEKLVEGTKDSYGLFITTADGEAANKDNEEWWCVTKGGESVMTGVSSTPFADGDVFELTFTIGY